MTDTVCLLAEEPPPAAPVPASPVTLPNLGGPVAIWTDGSCRPNPGPGGWAAIMQAPNGCEKKISGAELLTTNNRMELTAAIHALEALKRPCRVILHADSEYVVLGMTLWLDRWQRDRWRTAKGKPVENADLWRQLADVAASHEMQWRWTRGHAGDPMNERVDRLANTARRRMVSSDG